MEFRRLVMLGVGVLIVIVAVNMHREDMKDTGDEIMKMFRETPIEAKPAPQKLMTPPPTPQSPAPEKATEEMAPAAEEVPASE